MTRLNNADDYESIGSFRLSKEKTPIAFKNKVQELMEDSGLSKKEAEKEAPEMETELEIYYEPGQSLFAVDSEAVDSTVTIFSPYTGIPYAPSSDDIEDEDELQNIWLDSLIEQKRCLQAEIWNHIPNAIRRIINSFSIDKNNPCTTIEFSMIPISDKHENYRTCCPKFTVADNHCEIRYPAYLTRIALVGESNNIELEIEYEYGSRTIMLVECTDEQLEKVYSYLKILKESIEKDKIIVIQEESKASLRFADEDEY